MTPSRDVGSALIAEVKRHLLEESWPRLRKVVPMLSDEEIWHRVNEETNSVGNLLLHLNGNIRQWIVSGLGGIRDERTRAREFSERGPIPGADLLSRLDETLNAAAAVLDALDPKTLLASRRIQGDDTDGLHALLHVMEHFSYHVGQVTHMVKASKSVDVGYYRGRNLDALNEPGAGRR
jgi:uncharacterized damage-inducible protein DinB